MTLIARFMGATWAHLGPTGPRWAPCWPHELCHLGTATCIVYQNTRHVNTIEIMQLVVVLVHILSMLLYVLKYVMCLNLMNVEGRSWKMLLDCSQGGGFVYIHSILCFSSYVTITVSSNVHYAISNHWQLNCFSAVQKNFKSLYTYWKWWYILLWRM